MQKKKLQKSTLSMELASERDNIQFINTGSMLINCVISGSYKGGYPIGRMVNLVGDKSTGKTLLAIEAAANFHNQYPEGRIRFSETEAAFDEPYAHKVGLPIDCVEFPNSEDVEEPVTKLKSRRYEIDSDEAEKEETEKSLKNKQKRKGKAVAIESIEDLAEDMQKFIDEVKGNDTPCLYVLDSFDGLSSDAEISRDFNDATFGGEKAKKSNELFRRLVRRIRQANICFLLISQTRDSLSRFGPRKIRSGGASLDFYASQILWLEEKRKIIKKVKAETRPIGIVVEITCKKNKIAPPFRSCQFPIEFNYGIDDLAATYEWFKNNDKNLLKELTDKTAVIAAVKSYNRMSPIAKRRHRKALGASTQILWDSLEDAFLPQRPPKYE